MRIMHKSHLSLREHNLREMKIMRLPSDRKLEETNGDQKTPKMRLYCRCPTTYSDLSKSKILLKRDQNWWISSECYRLKSKAINRIPERRFRDIVRFRLKPKSAQETLLKQDSLAFVSVPKSLKINETLPLNGDVLLSPTTRFFFGSHFKSS